VEGKNQNIFSEIRKNIYKVEKLGRIYVEWERFPTLRLQIIYIFFLQTAAGLRQKTKPSKSVARHKKKSFRFMIFVYSVWRLKHMVYIVNAIYF
jgi:hypothetical protein